MLTLPREVLREMIKEGNLKTAYDLHSYLKDIFKDDSGNVRSRARDRIWLYKK
ncbi:hypothetical protein [Lutispora thermophila]|uniref:Uncharacterized protein n=1 Tax=Lutispora thermophila DSM 19022 TaxID=1122184 RepID=A0A1M6IF91_9FIRM|nr:hypothetical protein [Lutispora thermophila]SHJ33122.1 hypothetical protein SAMN02745176_03229 [Lutispora thermophila DSM 19022]